MTKQEQTKLLKRLSVDRVYFASKVLRFKGEPFKLHKWQREFLEKTDILNGHTALLKSRQCGGSLCSSVLCVHAASFNPYSEILIISKTKKQAGYIFNYCRDFCKRSPLLHKKADWRRTTKEDIYFHNGSIIKSRTIGVDAENIRGETANGVVFDECSYLKNSAVKNCEFMSMTGGVLAVSTPRYSTGAFYNFCHDPKFKTIHVPYQKNERIGKEQVDYYKRTMPKTKFRQELLAEFCSGENSVFDEQAIKRAVNIRLDTFDPSMKVTSFPPSKLPLVWSMDLSALRQDLTTLVIAEYDSAFNKLRVIAYWAWGPKTQKLNCEVTSNPDHIISRIAEFKDYYGLPTWFGIDGTANKYFIHTVQNKLGFYSRVEEINWSTSKKQQMIEKLDSVLRAGLLELPPDSEIEKQLLDYSYDLKRMEDLTDRKLYLGDGDDDWVSVLCQLATWLQTEEQYDFCDFIATV